MPGPTGKDISASVEAKNLEKYGKFLKKVLAIWKHLHYNDSARKFYRDIIYTTHPVIASPSAKAEGAR